MITKSKNHLILFSLLLASLVIISVPSFLKAANTTYYVNQTLGNDSWSGTVTDGDFLPTGCEDDNNSSDCTNGPWKTIAKVNATTLGSGDRILFNRGNVWFEQLTVVNSGSAGSPIYFGSYGNGSKPVIDAQGVRTAAITISGARSYLTFENLIIQNAAPTSNLYGNFTAATRGGSYLTLNEIESYGGTKSGIAITGASNSSYTNLIVNNSSKTTNCSGLYIFDTSGNTTNNVTVSNIVTDNNQNGIVLNRITNLTANNLTATRNNYWGIAVLNFGGTVNIDGVISGGSAGMGNAFYGILVQTAAAPTVLDIKNVISSHNSYSGFYFLATNDSNITSASFDNILSEYAGNSDQGIIISGDNITITDSISRYNAGSGFYFSGSSSNVAITDSVANNNNYDGFTFSGSGNNVLIERCKSFNNGNLAQSASGDGFTSHDTVSDLKIVNSLSYNNLNSGLAFIGTGNGSVYNSVFYNNGVSGFQRGGFWSNISGGSGWLLKNNIFLDNYPREIHTDVTGANYFTGDYNQFYHPDNASFATFTNGSSNQSWDTYHETNGHEPNSKYGDPLLSDPENINFEPTTNSPVIDGAFTDNNTPLKDILKKARFDRPGTNNTGTGLNSYTDVGAFEYRLPTNPEITSPSHPLENQWYSDNHPEIELTSTSSSTIHYHYNISQEQTPLKTTVESGPEESDGFFMIEDETINQEGTWYIHLIAHNSDHESSASYDSYTINYAQKPSFENLPGDDRPINIDNGQIIRSADYKIKTKPNSFLGVSRVNFYVDNNLVASDTEPDPDGVYEGIWDTKKYHSDIRVVAIDTEGREGDPLLRTATVILPLDINNILPSAGQGIILVLVISALGATFLTFRNNFSKKNPQ